MSDVVLHFHDRDANCPPTCPGHVHGGRCSCGGNLPCSYKAPSSPAETTNAQEQRPDHTGVIRGADEAVRLARLGSLVIANDHLRGETLRLERVIGNMAETHRRSRATITRRDAAIKQVRALHVSEDNDRDAEWCVHDRMTWPCPTIVALNAADDRRAL